jgi:glutaredoxin
VTLWVQLLRSDASGWPRKSTASFCAKLGYQDARSRQLPQISFITKKGCHLCEDAEQILLTVCGELGMKFEKLSLEDEPELSHLYQEEIPVVLIDGIQHSAWRIDPAKLRAALSK